MTHVYKKMYILHVPHSMLTDDRDIYDMLTDDETTTHYIHPI